MGVGTTGVRHRESCSLLGRATHGRVFSLGTGRIPMELRNRVVVLGTIIAAMSVGHTNSVAAQDEPFKFEITPIASYRIGGSFDEKDGDGRVELNDSSAAGFAFNVRANPNGQYELLYARQSTDTTTRGFFVNDPTINIDVDYLQFGGTYLFDGNKTRPFIALTLGLTQFDPAFADTGSERFFSASFGGGVQIMPKSRVGIRLEARVYTTFVDDNSSIFCSSVGGAGTCLVQVDAKTLSQWEARAGLVFRF